MTQDVTISVADFKSWDMPGKLTETIEKLQAILAEIPEEYRGSAEIDFTPEYSYGDSFGHISITYRRPETAAETEMREQRERADKVRLIERSEAEARRLKKELGL